MSYTISVWSLMGANFERYIAICKPMQCLSRTTKKAAIGCVGIWLAAFAVCSPLLDAVEVRYINCKFDCSNRFKWSRVSFLGFYGFHTLFVFVLPLAYMAYTFRSIIRALNTSTKTSQDKLNQNFQCPNSRARRSSEGEKVVKMRKRNRKITKVLLVVTTVFVVLWSPYVLLRMLRHSGVPFNAHLWGGSQLFMLMSSATNFFIYAIMSKEMRREFKSIMIHACCCCCCCCCRRGGVGGSSRSSSTRSESTRTQRISQFGDEEYQMK